MPGRPICYNGVVRSSEWSDLPQPARAIAEAITAAVIAARDTDAAAYRVVTPHLATQSVEQVGIVAGETVRLLLEDRYPDGLTGDDLREVLTDCAVAADWYPEFDPTVAATLVAGALGVHEADGERLPLSAAEVAAHGPLVIAGLASTAAHPLPTYLRAALAEIARTQTMD